MIACFRWVARQKTEKAKTLMELHDDVAKEEMAKAAQRQGRDRNRSLQTNVKGRRVGGLQVRIYTPYAFFLVRL